MLLHRNSFTHQQNKGSEDLRHARSHQSVPHPQSLHQRRSQVETGPLHRMLAAFIPPAGLLFIFGLSALRLADQIAVALLIVVAQGHKTLIS